MVRQINPVVFHGERNTVAPSPMVLNDERFTPSEAQDAPSVDEAPVDAESNEDDTSDAQEDPTNDDTPPTLPPP